MKTKIQLSLFLAIVIMALVFAHQDTARAAMIEKFCTTGEYPLYFCDDFEDGNADGWIPEGGNWYISRGGRYIVEGTQDYINRCGVDRNQSIIQGLTAHNVDVELDMESLVSVDKVIVLRSANSGHQIELNFRAERPGAFPADLVVQEWVNCEFMLHTPEFSVLIPPHQVGEVIHTHIRLTGQRLEVWIDHVLVLDQEFPFSAKMGKVGVTGIGFGLTAFDNVEVTVLRP